MGWIAAKDGDYITIHEDGGNDFGERKFLAKVGTPMEYYFVAMSGGEKNSRVLAGVSGVAGSFAKAAGHEFSGATDLSGMLAKDALGNFLLSVDDATGARRKLEATIPIDEKSLLSVFKLTANGVVGLKAFTQMRMVKSTRTSQASSL